MPGRMSGHMSDRMAEKNVRIYARQNVRIEMPDRDECQKECQRKIVRIEMPDRMPEIM